MLARSGAAPVWVSPQDVDDLNRLLTRVQEVRSRDADEHSDSRGGDY
jgi:hypothetical protein